MLRGILFLCGSKSCVGVFLSDIWMCFSKIGCAEIICLIHPLFFSNALVFMRIIECEGCGKNNFLLHPVKILNGGCMELKENTHPFELKKGVKMYKI